MEYCDECESLMYITKKDGEEILICRRCGFSKSCGDEVDKDSYKIGVQIRHTVKDQTEIIRDSDLKVMPKTRAECPKCQHKEAEYWQLQTRSADEGMTTFYRCTNCKYTWRAY